EKEGLLERSHLSECPIGGGTLTGGDEVHNAAERCPPPIRPTLAEAPQGKTSGSAVRTLESALITAERPLSCEALDPLQVFRTLPSEHSIGESTVDRRKGPGAFFERLPLASAVLEPRSDICPVPERAPYVAGDRTRKPSGATLTADKHGHRLATTSR